MKLAFFGSTFQRPACLPGIARLLDAIVTRSGNDVALAFEHDFLDYLQTLGVVLPSGATELSDGFLDSADMAVCLGGDGTILHAASLIGGRETPVLGINTGHLGYLAATNLDNVVRIAENLFAGNYVVERRSMLRACQNDACAMTQVTALNEIAVLKRDSASMIMVEARVNGQLLATYRADGLIVSTPTGSTGYNLSVGGPIVAPETGVWVIAPICAHTLTMRPLVVPDTATVALRVSSRTGTFLLSFDGTSLELPEHRDLTIDKAPYCTRLVMGHSHNFIDTLRDKLLWGAD